MQITKHILFIGLNDKDSKTQKIDTENAKNIIFEEVGDCTISDAVGSYTHEDGTRVREKALRVEILFQKDKQVEKHCKNLKEKLNQESIALEKQYINSVLI